MSRDHHPPLRDVTADTENTASSIVACWTVFTELLPGNELIKSVTICNITTLLLPFPVSNRATITERQCTGMFRNSLHTIINVYPIRGCYSNVQVTVDMLEATEIIIHSPPF
jgi:hypothetical protein